MTDTFIHEMPLRTTPHDEAVLGVRLEAARNLCNACLREPLRRPRIEGVSGRTGVAAEQAP
jgi:hypothetical protein